MKRAKIFISSVQSEFAKERHILYEYLTTDALLGRFFEPFIFESLPATDQRADRVYLDEVRRCDIYIGLFGKEYGYEDLEGISPTEREFDLASSHHKTRLVFLSNRKASQRHPKETALIEKAEGAVIRKQFETPSGLKSAVYASLVRYLEEKEYIRTGPFDATLNTNAKFDDLDPEKIKEFATIAKTKRGFPLPVESSPETILTHLNLWDKHRICNAAILLFARQPQRFFISSEVKCAHFHGTEITKPIPSLQAYKGDVFQLVNQAVDFVLSKIDAWVGTRETSTQVPVEYELPRVAVTEAIVNAIAHRDYTNNGSVQVMLFKDRLEIWNPGSLPHGLTTAKLREPHNSIPANPLLAEPMYLAGYIERMGTGTGDIIKQCRELSLKEPEFIQEDIFKTIIWRKQTIAPVHDSTAKEVDRQATRQATRQVTRQVTRQDDDEQIEEVTEYSRRVILVLSGELRRAEIQETLALKDRENFVENYLNPSLESGYIEMIHPDNPKHPQQRYRLTNKGLKLKKQLEHKKY